MIRVYLDTNILILGSQKPEHDHLKLLSKEKKVCLFKSFHVDIEQHALTSTARRRRDLAMRDLYKSKENFLEFQKLNHEYESKSKSEENEKEYWSDVGIFPVQSSFDFIVSNYAFLFSGLMQDQKGELIHLENLITEHFIGEKDAFHLMSAHSGNMNYFLTWDKALINKCKYLGLIPKVITPTEFLEYQAQKSENTSITELP